MTGKAYGDWHPPFSRTFAGEAFSLAWRPGLSKRQANNVKQVIKQFGSKPYRVRIVEWKKEYFVYTHPALSRGDGGKAIESLR